MGAQLRLYTTRWLWSVQAKLWITTSLRDTLTYLWKSLPTLMWFINGFGLNACMQVRKDCKRFRLAISRYTLYLGSENSETITSILHQQNWRSLVNALNTFSIPHKWIVVSAHSDWLIQRWIASTSVNNCQEFSHRNVTLCLLCWCSQ